MRHAEAMALVPVPRAQMAERAASPATLALAGLTALAVAMGIGRFAFTPILPMMQDDGLSVTAGGWLASANYLGYFLGSISAVVLRLRRTTVIRTSLVLIGVVTLGMGLVRDLPAWVVLRIAAGVASAWVLVFVSSWTLEKLAPFRRPLLNSLVFAGVGTGIAAAGGACLVLMRAGASSSAAWLVLGALSVGATATIWRVVRANGGESAGESRSREDSAYRWTRESVRLVVCYGAFGFGYIVPATFLPVMARQFVPDPTIFGWAWPIFGVAAAASTPLAAGAARFVGNRRLWGMAQAVMAFGVALPVFWSTTGGIMLAALFVGGTFMVITMTGMQEARHVVGRHATALMAAMTSAFAAGQIAGPMCATYLVDAGGGFSGALVLASVLLTLSACVLLRGSRRSTAA